VHSLQWTRKTTRKNAENYDAWAFASAPKTMGRLLRKMGFSLRVNHKTLESGYKNPPPRVVHNRQFRYIRQKRDEFASRENSTYQQQLCRQALGELRDRREVWPNKRKHLLDYGSARAC
jgi:DDE family transposase